MKHQNCALGPCFICDNNIAKLYTFEEFSWFMHEIFWKKLTNKCHLFWELYHEVGSFVTPWPRCGQTRLDRQPLNSALLADELHGKRKAVVALCTWYCAPLKFVEQSLGNAVQIFTCKKNIVRTVVNFHETWNSLHFHSVHKLNFSFLWWNIFCSWAKYTIIFDLGQKLFKELRHWKTAAIENWEC